MRILFILLLALITLQVNAQKIIQAGSFATQSALNDTADAIRALTLKDTLVVITNASYTLEDSFDISAFKKAVFILKASGSSSAILRMPLAIDTIKTTIHVMAIDGSSGSCGLLFASDLNGSQLTSTIEDFESGIYVTAKNPLGGYMWIETKSANVDNDG